MSKLSETYCCKARRSSRTQKVINLAKQLYINNSCIDPRDDTDDPAKNAQTAFDMAEAFYKEVEARYGEEFVGNSFFDREVLND